MSRRKRTRATNALQRRLAVVLILVLILACSQLMPAWIALLTGRLSGFLGF